MSDASLAQGFTRPFNEQVAAFRLRLGTLVPTARWDDLWQEAHDRAFMVAGAAKADLLADLGVAVDRAIAEGGTLEDFRRDFRTTVAKHGWHGWTGEGTKAGEAWRTRVIYRTNMATSYAAGRLAQLKAAGFPLWIYRHSGAEHPRLDHKSWDRLVLPADHPFWAQHYPPNGWGCGCKVSGTHSVENARRRGGNPDKPLPDNWDQVDPATGAQRGIGKGWGYAPGATVSDQLMVLKDKLPKLPAPIGAAWFASLPDRRRAEMERACAEFVGSAIAAPHHRGLSMVIGALKPEWLTQLAALDAMPATAEMTLTDEAIFHMRREAKPSRLPDEWLRGLSLHLRSPSGLLLQPAKGKRSANDLLLLFDTPMVGAKLVVHLDYEQRKGRGPTNLIWSGKLLNDQELSALEAVSRVLKP